MRAGLLSPEEAKESRFRNIITRSVGFEPSVEPDLVGLPVQAGDCYVLCSDGLSNYVSVEELGQVLNSHFYRDVATRVRRHGQRPRRRRQRDVPGDLRGERAAGRALTRSHANAGKAVTLR